MENIPALSFNNKLLGDHNTEIIDVSKYNQLSINSWIGNETALIGLIWYDGGNPIAHNTIICKKNEMINTKTNIISNNVRLSISSIEESIVRVFISGKKKGNVLIQMKRRLSNTPKPSHNLGDTADNVGGDLDLDTSPIRSMINNYETNIIQKKDEPVAKRFSLLKSSPKIKPSGCKCSHLSLPPLILPGNVLYCSKANTLEVLAGPANNSINLLAIKNKTIYWIEADKLSYNLGKLEDGEGWHI